MGPHFYLRWKLHMKFYRLNIDDQLIRHEGLEGLTNEELRSACHERGMALFDTTDVQLRSQLQLWLDLHINKGISITTLLLSNNSHSTVVVDESNILEKAKPMQIVHPKASSTFLSLNQPVVHSSIIQVDVKNHRTSPISASSNLFKVY